MSVDIKKNFRSKKIIIAGAAVFPGGHGGAVRCMHMLAKGFAANGHQVEVVTAYGSEERKSSYELDGFDVKTFAFAGDDKHFTIYRKLKPNLSLLIYLLYLIFKGNHDLVLLYGPVVTFPLVAIFARIMGQRISYYMADIRLAPKNISLSKKIVLTIIDCIDIALAKLCDFIIVLGTEDLALRYKRIASKTKQIRTLAPVDTKLFSKCDGENFRKKHNFINKRLISYSGNIDTLEGVDILIKAMKNVVEKFPNVILVLAGQPTPIDYVIGKPFDFKMLAKQIGIEKYVFFTGHIQLQEVINLLSASDVLVMPKIDHPLNRVASPIKIAEYMAAGRPIISSKICELEKHMEHGVDLLFCEPGDIYSLSENIILLLTNDTLRIKLSNNASVVANNIYDKLVITDKICKTIFFSND